MPRILAIDHGTVRIGLALSDELELVASPFKTLESTPQSIDEIVRVVAEKRIGKIVIGMPLHMKSGDKGGTAARVEKFGEQLGKALKHDVPIEYVDERLSSVTAERALKESGQKVNPRDGVVDQLAAVVILQDYLNTSRGPEGFLLPEPEFDMPWMGNDKKGRR